VDAGDAAEAGRENNALAPVYRRIAIRYGEDPQRRGERTLLDRLAAQELYQSVSCSTAL
jgi:hypothetical protein